MKVLKFGGTSVGSVESIRNVMSIISSNLNQNQNIIVVYSAMSGVTNGLIELGNLATQNETEISALIKNLENRHFETIKALVNIKFQSALIAEIKSIFNEIEDLLRGISFIKELSSRTSDLLVSFGERLSTTLIGHVLQSEGLTAEYVDARKIIKTNSNFGFGEVDFKLSNSLIKNYFDFKNPKTVYCVTGFIASNTAGQTTTLGRGGSDYTASILGAALDAESIEIWTDVNGMMTADPRKVKNAFTIKDISYAEAMELSHFGAKVIYPPSLVPAFQKNIPISIKNTFEADNQGSIINRSVNHKPFSITGISSIDDICLVNLQGNGLIGVAGVSAKVFGILAENNISVILISQASSEHSICFAIDPKVAEKVSQLLDAGFKHELQNGDIDSILVEEQLSILAIVGEGMKASSGTSGKLFSVMGKNGINVVATAQGSSELNISVVISRKDLSKALNAIHAAFFEVEGFSMNLFVLGPTGLIGKTLLKQMAAQENYLIKERNLTLRLAGIANTKKMLLDAEGISIQNWEQALDKNGEKVNLSEFIIDVQALNLPNSVFIDCTADRLITQYYSDILKSSISIVTPNKVANSGTYQEYSELRQIAKRRNVKFLYETNVGAGLPVINTLQGLINSGDKIRKIEAVLSGTLSFIFNTFTPQTKFVDVVKQAKQKGFTEPDPREDLSGVDVARKILILARETGLSLEMNDVKINPILSEKAMNANSVEAFYDFLENENDIYAEKIMNAEANGRKLRFVARLENGLAEIGLQEVDTNHPFFNLSGSENIISYTTDRYPANPLVVKGPGAGAEVTATGVFADIISLSSFLA